VKFIMVTDGIMEIIWDMMESILEEIRQLKNAQTRDVEASPELKILEAKLALISEVEEKLGDYEGY